MNSVRFTAVVCVLIAGLPGSSANAVNIETVPVGNPGNQLSPPFHNQGAVQYSYRLGKYEVTAGQYTEFLNAVAASDTHGLYNTRMADPVLQVGCNIQRSGVPGHYQYSVASDWANRPVNYVSFLDACRFANWLHNGKPVGNQDLSTTEDGAYFMNGGMRTVTRKANWNWAVPTEDEWYKAAYYKGGSTNAGYWGYATRSDAAPGRDMNDLSGNNANYDSNVLPFPIEANSYTTIVGHFQNSPSGYGTFDQNGNVNEWCESRQADYGISRGGSFLTSSNFLTPYIRPAYGATFEGNDQGFRVVQLPEPASLALLSLGCFAVLRRRGR